MKYLADILTLSRFILAFTIWFLALFGGSPDAAFVLFVLAELTDAFDGTCARKWPFKKGQEPAYRQYAVKYDMLADAFLWFVTIFYLIMQLNHTVGMAILSITIILCGVVEIIVYGKLFGHPDDCTKNSLCKRNFPLAKKLVMGRRYFYLLTIIVAAAWMLAAASWGLAVKISLLVIGLGIGIFLWCFLKQRRQHISRNAVALETKLSKTTKRKK